ncbi:MAG TPA: hypothetical protein VHE78_14580 [Gemmatimonadaceae bacterium]|nr:hypothetical protein [Gemmatimonadaceae bacterium]
MANLSVHSVRTALGALCATVCAASVHAQQLPPIHALGPVEHASKDLLGAVSSVRALPGGRVLVNDNGGRKVVLFDPALARFSVVADTTSATANAYSSRAAGLIAYKGDSTLIVDPVSLSMLVIDGAGAVARVMSVPRPSDASALIGGSTGTPAFDARGRLVYRAPPLFNFPKRSGDGPIQPPAFPDTAPLVRIDLATRKVDTIGYLKIAKINMSMTQDANGRMSMSSITNPMPVTDDWAVLADGSVALLRGQDYHIDWIRVDGQMQPTPKVPFAWRHMTDSSKAAFIDSAKTAMEKLREQFNAQRAAGGNMPNIMGPPDGGGAGGGMVVMFGMERKGGAETHERGGPPTGGPAPVSQTLPPLQFVAPNELPDYAPPFTAGSARGDADGNLWVRTSNVLNGGSVYDVINGKGELIDRVVVPPGRVIAGFGAGGVVYMGVRELAGVRLEQARRSQVSLP